MRVPSLGREDPLEEGMATHSSVLAWRIPGMGEPGGLPSMGSCGTTHVARLEFPRETGLILRCAGKAGNPFQTTQGNRLSCRGQEGRRGSDEPVPGPSVFPSREPGVPGNFWSFSYLEPFCCSMSSSNCCFLTCIQISQEDDQVVWYSHLLQNFPVYCDPHSQRLWHSQLSRNRCFSGTLLLFP